MMSANEPPAADQRRFAEYLIADIDGDPKARNRILTELESAPGGLLAAYLTAAQCYKNLLVSTACHGSPSTAREVLVATALDASLHEGPGDD
jgi:hypothetical protein